MGSSRLLFVFPVWILLTVYFYQSLKVVTTDLSSGWQSAISYFYWIWEIVLMGLVVYLVWIAPRDLLAPKVIFVIIGLVLLSIIPKLLVLPFLLFEDLARLGERLWTWNSGNPYPPRRAFINQFIVALAAVPFGAILYGMVGGKYNYRVHRKTLSFKDLPESFDGFTITQLSDIHAGSFDSREGVKKGIDLANEQNSDLLVFTGDMVNDRAAELEDWKELIGELRAPLGKFSILGNHDYGDYAEWKTAQEKKENLERLKQVQKEMGFRLLLDESVQLRRGEDFINLAGIQNWGARGFAQYGNLGKAMASVQKDSFTVLLSHDPSHWEAQVLKHEKHIHLTLSGHTHGMQFGVEIPGIRWSPVQYVYKQWAGIYRKAGRYLNVNRGFGFIGFSGRVGIMPEITVITLRKAK